MDIKKILNQKEDAIVNIKGWIRFNRTSKKLGFLEVYDGSNLNGIQIVYKKDELEEEQFNELIDIPLFSAIDLDAKLVFNSKQNIIEGNLLKINEIAKSSDNHPLQKKEHSLEFLREIAYLRPRTKTFQAIFKIRSLVIFALHGFFQENDFIYVNSPIITSNDAEGAGETFKVVTNNSKDFFTSGSASLSVSGQLHAEAFAQSFGRVYTLAPTFRAENSNTQKHASEFWMLEPEIAFMDYHEIMELSANMLAYVASYLQKHAQEYIDFLSEVNKVDLNKRLELLMNKKIKKISYNEAIEILQDNRDQFEINDISFGLDLATEHEKFLATYFENYIVYIYDYPKTIKAFYMKQNTDKKTVRGFDLIIPEIGELIGGSERENDYDTLLKAVKKRKINQEDLEWYIDLRKLGYLKSSGFGLGIERLIMFLTGVKNIRDTLPFPRTPGKITY